MWADSLGDGTYRLDNVPLFAYGVNLHDVFTVKAVNGDPRPYFGRVIKRSGNRTVRLTLPDANERLDKGIVDRMLSRLAAVSDGRDSYGPDYFVYNVPKERDYWAIAADLNEGEEQALWSWELTIPEPDVA